MKHKVSELHGVLLDAAVAQCEGHRFRIDSGWCVWAVEDYWSRFNPSSDWSIGGLIIERERIALDTWFDSKDWTAAVMNSAKCAGHPAATGPRPLIAAMRAYVASKCGDEVELP